MKKKLTALVLAMALSISVLVMPSGAFYVNYVTYSSFSMPGVPPQVTLTIEKPDGTVEKLEVYDKEGNQYYIQVGLNEWEKLDPPIPAAEVERMQAEAEKAEKAAAAKMKAEMEKKYSIKITDDFATNTSALEELEWHLQKIPEALRTKAAAQMKKSGKTLKIDDFINGDPSMAGSAGYYTSGEVAIYLMSTTAFVHEYGHFIFMSVLPKLYNSTTFQKEWQALTGSEPTHVTSYASTSYQEDLAETFHVLILSPETLRNMSVEVPDSLAYKKAVLMRNTLNKAFGLDDSVLPSLTPSVPSAWAKADVEEYQKLLGGSSDGVVPHSGYAHPTSYQASATRLQFVYAMSEDFVRNLYLSKYFKNMTYTEYESKWQANPGQANGLYQTKFDDVNKSRLGYYCVRAIHAMNVNGVINGKSDTIFDPQGQITRQEAATILYRLCNAVGYKLPKGSLSYDDAAKIAPWAQEAVAAVSAAGIMNGVGNNNFDPTGVYTCEQSALCILRTYKLLVS